MRPTLPALLLATALLAACAGNPGGRDGYPPARREMGGSATAIVDQLQEQLRTAAEALQLTPAQRVLWEAYQERVGALMADQMKLPAYRPARESAPQQISAKVDTVRNRLTALEEIQEAVNKLYASLDEPQRRTADRVLPATLPALYSGFAGGGEGRAEAGGAGERGSGPRGGHGGGMGGGGGGGMGGGFGRM